MSYSFSRFVFYLKSAFLFKYAETNVILNILYMAFKVLSSPQELMLK